MQGVFSRAVCSSVCSSPPRSEPANSQDFRPCATGRIICSHRLLSTATRRARFFRRRQPRTERRHPRLRVPASPSSFLLCRPGPDGSLRHIQRPYLHQRLPRTRTAVHFIQLHELPADVRQTPRFTDTRRHPAVTFLTVTEQRAVVTNGAKVGLPQLGWNLSGQRTHHPSPQ